jgi:hypothetical protein
MLGNDPRADAAPTEPEVPMATSDDQMRPAAAASTEDDSAMTRMSKAVGAWGVGLGGILMLVSVLLVWIVSSDAAGERDNIRAIENFTGQTLFLISILTVMGAAGIALSIKRVWRTFWCLLALLLGAIFLGAALWAIVDTDAFVVYAVSAQKYSTTAAVSSEANGVAAALESGALTAETGFGVILGIVAGALVVVGALVSLFRRRERAA